MALQLSLFEILDSGKQKRTTSTVPIVAVNLLFNVSLEDKRSFDVDLLLQAPYFDLCNAPWRLLQQLKITICTNLPVIALQLLLQC